MFIHISQEDLNNLSRACDTLWMQKLPVEMSSSIRKIRRWIKDDVADYTEERVTLLKQFALTDAEGNLIPHPQTGEAQFAPGRQDAFAKALEPIKDRIVEVRVQGINWKALQSLGYVEPMVLDGLWPVIHKAPGEDEDEGETSDAAPARNGVDNRTTEELEPELS